MIVYDNEIDLCTINQKYINRKFVLSQRYRKMKEILNYAVMNLRFKPPFRVTIYIYTYKDIDSSIKCILDGIEPCLGNDKDVYELFVFKERKKKQKDKERLKIKIEEI